MACLASDASIPGVGSSAMISSGSSMSAATRRILRIMPPEHSWGYSSSTASESPYLANSVRIRSFAAVVFLPASTCFPIFISGSSHATLWGTRAMPGTPSDSPVSFPLYRMLPSCKALAGSRPSTAWARRLLPDPLAPTTATISPL